MLRFSSAEAVNPTEAKSQTSCLKRSDLGVFAADIVHTLYSNECELISSALLLCQSRCCYTRDMHVHG